MTGLDLVDLDNTIRAEMDSGTCCHDLMYTTRWAKEHLPGGKVDQWLALLVDRGIGCDCEVLNNLDVIRKTLPPEIG
jgi:hypothetical protein